LALRWLSSVIAARRTSPAFPPQAFSAAGRTVQKYAEQRLDGTQLVISDAQTGLKGASERIAMLFMDAKKTSIGIPMEVKKTITKDFKPSS